MNTTALSAASSFNPGSDLWVIADRESSQWNLQIDWLCNFRLLAFERHRASKKSLSLQNIISETEMKLTAIPKPTSDSPLLLSSSQWLPNRWILYVPYSEPTTWVQKIGQAWTGLQRPTLRVFLPKQLSNSEFSHEWQHKFPPAEITLVGEVLVP